MKKYGLMLSLVVLLLAACSQQAIENLESQTSNYWKKLGDALDIVPKNNTANPKLLMDRNGRPVVVWAEDNGLWYLQAKRWNGTAWEKLPLPSKALTYTDSGVNPFDVVFDNSNALVISQLADPSSSLGVKIYRATPSAWVSLGAFNGLSQLQTNTGGQVHAVFQDYAKGDNIIKRWDGTAWRTVASFKKLIPNSVSSDYILADSFVLKTDGKPVVSSEYRPCPKCITATIWDWNGQTWNGVANISGPVGESQLLDYALTSDNKVITAFTNYDGFPLIKGAGIDTGLGYSGFLALAVKNKSPVVLYQNIRDNSNVGKVFAANWTGSKFVNLGGDIRRDTSKVFLLGDVVVDKNGTIFTVSQEAACYESASCGGANVYVSQYIP
jgi:hypothetical protein